MKNATTKKRIKVYGTLQTKARICSAHIFFNKQCWKEGLAPRYAVDNLTKVKCDPSFRAKFIKPAVIQQKDSERTRIFKRIMFLHRELSHERHPIEFEIMDDVVRLRASMNCFKQRQKHHFKLYQLRMNKMPNSVISFAPTMINLSDTIFTIGELDLLDQGMKYCPKPVLVQSI